MTLQTRAWQFGFGSSLRRYSVKPAQDHTAISTPFAPPGTAHRSDGIVVTISASIRFLNWRIKK